MIENLFQGIIASNNANIPMITQQSMPFVNTKSTLPTFNYSELTGNTKSTKGNTKIPINNDTLGLMNMSGSLMSSQIKTDPNQTAISIRDGITDVVKNLGPAGQVVSAALKVGNGISDVLGWTPDELDKESSARLGLSSTRTLNNIATAIPGFTATVGMFGGNTNTFNMSDEAKKLNNAYSGSVADLQATENLSDKRVLFGKNKINNVISEQQKVDNTIANIGEKQDKIKQGAGYNSQNLMSQNYKKYFNPNISTSLLAKEGMKFPELYEARNILKTQSESTIDLKQTISKFAEGGKMNIIAHGALHSRKNNLSEVNEDLNVVTEKGIPVISKDDDEIIQHAEIEGGELILTKEVTDELEKLYKDGSDEAMVKAGKLISNEILNNTDDKTNELIDNEINNK